MTRSTDIDIRREEGTTKGRYVARVNDTEAAMTFSRLGDASIIIDHTEVPDTLRGQGVGQALVARAVQDARAAGITIVPLCPFAKAQFARTPDWQDVLRR